MPVPLTVTWADGSTERILYPAEIWRKNAERVKKLIIGSQDLKRLEIDAQWEIADTDRSNNTWPPKVKPTRFQLFKKAKKKSGMRKAQSK